MFAWAEALFLLQAGGFSCLDTHGFNRRSTRQVKAEIEPRLIGAVPGQSQLNVSLFFPSFGAAPLPVSFRFIDANSPALLGTLL